MKTKETNRTHDPRERNHKPEPAFQEPDNFHEIDKNRLDEEWVMQPRLYRKYAERLADAERAYEQAKTECELAKAEVTLEVRRSKPEEHGLDKWTEAAIAEVAADFRKLTRAKENLLEKGHAVDVLKVAIRTLEHRKAALESLVQLRLSDYFSTPRVKGEGGKQMQDRAIDRAFGKRTKKHPTEGERHAANP